MASDQNLLQQGAHFVHHISTPTATLQLNLQVLDRYLPALVDHYRTSESSQSLAISADMLKALETLAETMQQSLGVIQQRTREFSSQLQQHRLAESPSAPVAASAVTQGQGRVIRKILIVEDEVIHQQVALHQLAGRCQVELANNGREAIDKCQSHRFDLVLMDFVLPGIGGAKVLQEIAAAEGPPPLVIGFSNLPPAAEEFADTAIPVAAHLQKPFKLVNLEALLADLGLTLAAGTRS